MVRTHRHSRRRSHRWLAHPSATQPPATRTPPPRDVVAVCARRARTTDHTTPGGDATSTSLSVETAAPRRRTRGPVARGRASTRRHRRTTCPPRAVSDDHGPPHRSRLEPPSAGLPSGAFCPVPRRGAPQQPARSRMGPRPSGPRKYRASQWGRSRHGPGSGTDTARLPPVRVGGVPDVEGRLTSESGDGPLLHSSCTRISSTVWNRPNERDPLDGRNALTRTFAHQRDCRTPPPALGLERVGAQVGLHRLR